MSGDFQIVAAGDAAFLVRFPERISAEINARAIALAEALRLEPLPGVRDVVPTYRTVAVYFDPVQTDHDRLLDVVQRLASADLSIRDQNREAIRIPVQYGGAFGPDLADVARFANASEQDVIDWHTARTYRVFMLGFVPGFAYMGTVDPRIAAPRRSTPRTVVPAGSVGIAGGQTGIYPAETPGGWQLVGRTDVRPFDLSRPDVCVFKPGDTVQFVAVHSR